MSEVERESMEFDVVIVGAGPAGLSAAIRLKQVNPELSVVVLEKGGEVGAHILSGAVVDPIGVDRLLPGWREEGDHPFKTAVTDDHFLLLGPAGSVRLPNFLMPPLMNNHGNYIVSLGNVCRWLASKAEALGVEIYPASPPPACSTTRPAQSPASTPATWASARRQPHGPNYAPGMALMGKYVLIGEGVRGSLAKQLIAEVQPAGRSGARQVRHRPQGALAGQAGKPQARPRAAFLRLAARHEDRRRLVPLPPGGQSGRGRLRVHLNYKNPYLSPFEEFQRFKTHPAIRGTFEGGKRLSYGARAITEGGWQSVPKLSFPGGALIGCSAGFVNVPRIKGSHNAVLSGMLAAEHVAEAIAAGRANDELAGYENTGATPTSARI
jgi:electron-transferring-flavoprotein dehydrogenase